ncbi:iron-containing alcohol dehydrogenase [Treponema phagedenis]|uniref:Iron-containing alcohol dehydrogenase n=2 Tax=Treponema phagedenis TaxID=162 RepID=A0A0B7GZQ6_TREPH|nr:iron-containing alcohol dehydrogenase [Treponema phagedenis]EFW37261.1 alcohol dehydrogenase, iron-dependent [Treponema phagedenis F0421]NVP23749.1 iron-containing alcohol dehydrogenase [Treponema phagedenis]QEJ94431.1 iron-containing alcohol dehydrogenase [Treponema phagedenis]QEJ97495.1 iron-containing alcohol dehydrogenase [Treponema phagedenis]QEK01688.1 iron-containing alcohol dehydrogenase [Treponema phagedenis]
MFNFNFHIPTKILFGQGKIAHLADEISAYGSRVLFCYGGGSIKKIGLYDEIIEQFSSKGIFYQELSGISPNPRIEEVREGIKLIREHQLNFILPVGGGSTIDCAKAISAGAAYQGDAWDLVIGKAKPQQTIPIGTVLTLSATGSEMNGGAVISNMETKQKLSLGSPLLLPKFSILDPSYTFSVSAAQTAAGTADIMSHTFENYFSLNDDAFLQNRLAEAILRTCIYYAPKALANPHNYDARANLMWAGTWAINGLLSAGKNTDWSVHAMEHELSAFYDITHGVGLAILTPHWLNYVLNETTVQRIATFGTAVWGIYTDDIYETAKLAIQKTSEFFASLGIPMRLRDVGIGEEHLQEMAEAAVRHKGGKIDGFQELGAEDVLAIYKAAL